MMRLYVVTRCGRLYTRQTSLPKSGGVELGGGASPGALFYKGEYYMEDDNILSEIVDHVSFLNVHNQRLILSEILLLQNAQEQGENKPSQKPNI